MKDPSLSDDDIRRLLNAITADDSIKLPDKGALRHRMVDEFRTGLSPGTPRSDQQSDHDPVVVELSPEVLTEERSIPWGRIFLGAAAVALAVIGVVNLTREATKDSVETVAASPLDAPGPVDPGQYSVGSVADGIEFATSSAGVVTQLEPGLVVLQPAQGNSGASLSIMSADDSIEDVLEGHRETGVIRLIRSAAMSSTGPITEFEVRLQPGAPEDGCEGSAGCLTIGRVTIESGSAVTVREFLGPNDRRVWALYQSGQLNDPFQREANLILESLVITSAS